MSILDKILKILEGIDKTETETCPECNGWWETSTGVEFGEKKIEEIKALFKQTLNIYKIFWVQGGAFGLSAVVIASTEEEALRELHLNITDMEDGKFKKLGIDDSEIEISLIGVCTDGTKETLRVCQESL
jgi:hypothetical protein